MYEDFFKYSDNKPFATMMLQVSDLHEIYVEQCGNPEGVPVVFLHGGPGAGHEPEMRWVHDPEYYHFIQFDQRGCGKSRPQEETRENSTWHLVEDMEKIRTNLGIDRWIVSGGSWGVTLALAYAQKYPDRCLALVLRGIFMGRAEESRWFQAGIPMLRPDAWQAFVDVLAPGAVQNKYDVDEVYAAMYRQLRQGDKEASDRAAVAMNKFELDCCQHDPDEAFTASLLEDIGHCRACAEIAAFFSENKFWLEEDQLVHGLDKIRHIPCTIVQGRYDIVTPYGSAWKLHEWWPESILKVAPFAGHLTTEQGIASLLTETMEDYKSKFSKG